MISAPWISLAMMNKPKLLDTYPAAVGYSLRKLRRGATKCLRVRRSSDNAEQDIGFQNGAYINTADLTTFCGAGDGFVVTWYNQMTDGASGNFVQATAAQQPMIVSAGTVLERYSHPMIQMNTTSKYLYCEDLTLFKNKNYNRVYFTLSKPDTLRYDNIVPMGLMSPLGFARFLFQFGGAIPTGRNIFAAAQTGVAYNDAEQWYLFTEDTTPDQAKFGESISTLNVTANWNSTASGVSDVCRRGVCTRHANDVVTNTTTGGTETANSYNETASIFTLGGWWNGSAITFVSPLLGYNELIIYSDATYHGSDSQISANIASYF